MTHDPHCPISRTDMDDCPICDLLAAARGEERTKATLVWKQNLRPIETRNYERGYRDAVNGRRPNP